MVTDLDGAGTYPLTDQLSLGLKEHLDKLPVWVARKGVHDDCTELATPLLKLLNRDLSLSWR